MPEGPEVRRHADMLHAALAGRRILSLSARTRSARAWLGQHAGELAGRRIERVFSHGKHLLGCIEDGIFFHSHLMMWGRWHIAEPTPPPDRRERARIVTENATAILTSAPVFDVGRGDPYECIEHLADLGPDVLPYDGPAAFERARFLRSLRSQDRAATAVGVALLDQTLVAGLGNYLRCDILHYCRIDPWKRLDALTTAQRSSLAAAIPLLARRAYERTGTTVDDDEKQRLAADHSLVYQPGREYGTRHYVFRRTNLPCLQCGTAIRQQRQVTRADEEGERSRITYYCPRCQGVEEAERRPARAPTTLRSAASPKAAPRRVRGTA